MDTTPTVVSPDVTPGKTNAQPPKASTAEAGKTIIKRIAIMIVIIMALPLAMRMFFGDD